MVVVVPTEDRTSVLESNPKKYVGNNMNLDLVGNKKKKFLVVGNNCCVNIKDNLSSIKIVGDNCSVHVISGAGEVIYIGNNGCVFLDHSIDEKVLTYVGSNGKVSSKNGTMQRHSSDSDVRNCGKKVNLVNLNGQCNVSISGAGTKISAKKFAKIASSLSLPNVQIHIGTVTRHRRQD